MSIDQNRLKMFLTDGEEPVFSEPWEAHVFAITVGLHAQGYFSWAEWSQHLADAVAAAAELPDYEIWLQALEKLLTAKGIVKRRELLSVIDSIHHPPATHSH